MRLLAVREVSGIVVKLFWDETAPAGSAVMVRYRDQLDGVAYTIYPPSARALEAFYHPNAFLDGAVAERAYSVRV